MKQYILGSTCNRNALLHFTTVYTGNAELRINNFNPLIRQEGKFKSFQDK